MKNWHEPLLGWPLFAIESVPGSFEIFAFDTEVLGGRAVHIAPRLHFDFALEEVLDAITPQTGVVFITNPNNPTGTAVSTDAIADLLARIAKAGQRFYDPYTGLPMLVNLRRGVMYSVGHDGKDQDADPQQDVVVSIPLNQPAAAVAKPAPKSK